MTFQVLSVTSISHQIAHIWSIFIILKCSIGQHYVSFMQWERKVTLVIIKSISQGIKSLFNIMTKFSKCTFKITYVIANLKFSMHKKIYRNT